MPLRMAEYSLSVLWPFGRFPRQMLLCVQIANVDGAVTEPYIGATGFASIRRGA